MKSILLIFGCTLIYSTTLFAAPELIFAQIKNTPDQQIGASILKIAYGRLGIPIKFVEMPGKRALQESSNGRIDGEVHRIIEVGEEFSTLIRVPTAINYIEPTVFSKNYDFKVTNCAALKEYTIGIVGGIKHAELCTKGMDYVQEFGYSPKMMELLHLGRIDLAITAKINGLLLAKSMNLQHISPLSPPLRKMQVYHYLHQKNKDIVPKINQVFLEMQRSGELVELREKAIKMLLQKY